ncbi:MAG: hypothetical protein IJS82_01170, partial [Paludibacteraceae bacterium]|nr:hypothetical protein [Paludibacteraceae bacterium]
MIIKQIPPALIGGKTYFADEEGNIINAKGRTLKVKFSPSNRDCKKKGGSCYPHVSLDKERRIHSLVCATFWGKPQPD